MAKFSGATSPAPRGIIQTTQEVIQTHEGGQGYTRTPRSELFLTAITEMAEETFYESTETRRNRIAGLVQAVLAEKDGREWFEDFLPWLRNTAQMRSAPIILLGEMAKAGAQNLRPLVAKTLSRPDEPGELLGYWLMYHGRSIPAGLKRGIADAAVKLYSERSSLKWDGQSKGVRFGDVIDLTHPVPSAPWQSLLFKQLLDNRHNRPEAPNPELELLRRDHELQRLPEVARRAALPIAIEDGWSWERCAGWLPGGMDAEAWEALIPGLGYMALLRNLNNFEKNRVDPTILKGVAARLEDPEEVAKSRQFPYRFLSAYLATSSLTFAPALESALESSLQNIPVLQGSTLILIDTSGSMEAKLSAKSQASRTQVAALFGVALAKTAENADVVLFATDSMALPKLNRSASVLRAMENIHQLNGRVGFGTNTHSAIQAHLRPDHDRLIILTDEQSHDFMRAGGMNPWVHTINLAGYRSATLPSSTKTFSYGSFTDAMFKIIPLMESGARGHWPWDQ